MVNKNYRKQETRFFIGRINEIGERETLRMENYNSLPTALRDKFDIGRGFENAQTANRGVNFFNSVEEEKGAGRDFWYFLVSLNNIETVVINDKTDDVVKDYFRNLEDSAKEQPEDEEVTEEESVEEDTEE